MPPGASDDRLKAQDIEQKRARGAISCAECRRLKLKCDKTVPCSSCKRRGCEAICPNGKLVTGHGTRFVLADTDRLHKKINDMSERIRQLEDALAILQASYSSDQHPLLAPPLMKIKSNLEMHAATDFHHAGPSHAGGGGSRPGTSAGRGRDEESEEEETAFIDSFGTLAVHEDGGATFYGRSAGSESLMIGTEDSPRDIARAKPRIPPDVAQLSQSLPLALGQLPAMSMSDMIRRYMPHWARARALSDIYVDYESWFFQAVTRRQLEEQLLPMFYREAALPGVQVLNPGPHDLAVLFVVLCLGAIFDKNLPAPPERNAEAELYYHLSRAAINIQPILEQPSSLSTIQTFSTLAIYQALTCQENAIEGLWAHFGVATKLAQSIGLHRDCARWGLSNLEVHKRRSLFWEVCTTDCWVSLATGRIPTFPQAYVDCELALDPDETLSDEGERQLSLPAWKARFGARCLSVVAGVLTAKVPKYSTILEIDRMIRDLELPHFARGHPPRHVTLAATMHYFMPRNYIEYATMYLHRCFFAQALVDHPNDPLRSPYAPSFLAGYRSACSTIALLKDQYDMHPADVARVWVVWTHAFSATVMIASVITHGAKSKIAPMALMEMNKARDLFERAAAVGGRAQKFFPVVQRLHAKAYEAVSNREDGINPKRSESASPLSDSDKDKDHLHVFLGRTNMVSTKSSAPAQAQPAQEYHLTPPEAYAYTSLHPSLADQLHTFDAHLASGAPLEYPYPSQEPQAQYQQQAYAYQEPAPAEFYDEQSARHYAPSLRTGAYSQHSQQSQHSQHSQHQNTHTPPSHSPVEQWPAQGGQGGPMLLPHPHAPIHPHPSHPHPQHPHHSQSQSWSYQQQPMHPAQEPAYPIQPAYGAEPAPAVQEMWTSFLQQMELPRSPASLVLSR